MHTAKIGILEPDNFSKRAFSSLKEIGRVSLFTKGDLRSFIKDKEIIFIRFKNFISNDFLNSAPRLKYICSPTTGLNHLDLKEIKKRKIKVISLKDEARSLCNVRAAPEHILGLTLALLRNYKNIFLSLRNKEQDINSFLGDEIYNNKIGIIGFGRIGRILARYFNGLSAEVYFYDINKKIREAYGAKKISDLAELINNSNIICLCASYSPENRKFFNKKYIDLLKNKYFINASRGELVDEGYLFRKTGQNFFRGVALDVVSSEFKKGNNFKKLMKNCNVIITPHIGGSTFNSRWKTEEFIVKKLKNEIE